MPARYAEHTRVDSGASRAEIERTLVRYGATAFQYGWEERGGMTLAVLGFKVRGRVVKFSLPLPDRRDKQFTEVRVNQSSWATRERSPQQQEVVYEQAVKQRWRALLLVIKAKLEAVAAGIVTLESEFLSQTLLPSGETIGEWVEPQVEQVYRTGGMPSLLPGTTPRTLPAPEATSGHSEAVSRLTSPP